MLTSPAALVAAGRFSTCLALWLTVPGVLAAGAELPILTTASEVRTLSKLEAATHPPVRLHGVVLGEAEPGGEGLAIQDDTYGIYLRGNPSTIAQLHPGDRVEVEGVADPGEFAPFVRARTIRKVGTAPLPEPKRATYEELASGELDAQWVEVSGVVRYYQSTSAGSPKCRLEMATGGGRLLVRINRPHEDQALVDASVRLRGVCYYLVNKNRQSLRPLLAVPHDVPWVIERPAPANPFDLPVRSVGTLMQFNPDGSYGHRVHVEGVVTCQQPDGPLWISDGKLGLRVQLQQPGDVIPGDKLDVLGFPEQGDYSPVLNDAVFRIRSHDDPPSPTRLDAAGEAFDYDASLVAIEGVVSERQPTLNGWAFVLEADDGTLFKALLRTRERQPAPAFAQPGARVLVSGICTILREQVHYGTSSTGLLQPNAFQLLLRSTADIALLQPPSWWKRERFIWLLAGLTGASLFATATVLLIARGRLREQTTRRAMAEAEFSAILKERNRMAREIHDTLAQGLGAISMHLENAKDRLSAAAAEGAVRHLELAHHQVRTSLSEARNSIWNMRSQVLEKGDLGSALEGVLKQLNSGGKVEASIRVLGQTRRLPPVTENNLLRIGQEAIANAIRHAKARRIEVTLEFADRHVRLAVTDDGCGFDPDRPPPSQGSFGLVGMRERATLLQGTFTLRSRPGQGTEVGLSAPVAGPGSDA